MTQLNTHSHTPTGFHLHVRNTFQSFFYSSGWRPRRPLHHWRVPSWRAGLCPRWHLCKHTKTPSLTQSVSHKHPHKLDMKIKYFTFALHLMPWPACNCTSVCSLSRWWKALRTKAWPESQSVNTWDHWDKSKPDRFSTTPHISSQTASPHIRASVSCLPLYALKIAIMMYIKSVFCFIV